MVPISVVLLGSAALGVAPPLTFSLLRSLLQSGSSVVRIAWNHCLEMGVLPDSSSIAQHPGKCQYSDNQWEGPDPSLGSFTALADGLRSLVFTPVVFFFPPKITDSDKYKNNIYALDIIIIIEHIILIYISITKYIILL